jgi:hypothetical protein
MGFQQRLLHEFKAVGVAALYFGCWLAVLLVIKQLILAEYHIEFSGLSKAVAGALILSKVVLVLEHVSLGAWVRARPAWVDVVVRTLLYAMGVLLVMLLERGFEGRHEYGGFAPSLGALFEQADIYHVWTNTIVLTGALLVYNLLAVVRRHLGEGGLLRLFMTPMPIVRHNSMKQDRSVSG